MGSSLNLKEKWPPHVKHLNHEGNVSNYDNGRYRKAPYEFLTTPNRSHIHVPTPRLHNRSYNTGV